METNQLSKKQIDLFNRAGWIVQGFKENDILEHLGEETLVYILNAKGFSTRSILIDYAKETMLVIEADTRGKLHIHTHYDSYLPTDATGTIAILGATKIIDNQLLNKLLNA